MVVDDDPDLRHIVKLILEAKGGFTARVCDCGMQALREVGEFRPDLIILDVMMDGMDGPETLGELRKLPDVSPVPVFFMTSMVQPRDVMKYKTLGVAGVIKKPFQPLALANQVKELWRQI